MTCAVDGRALAVGGFDAGVQCLKRMKERYVTTSLGIDKRSDDGTHARGWGCASSERSRSYRGNDGGRMVNRSPLRLYGTSGRRTRLCWEDQEGRDAMKRRRNAECLGRICQMSDVETRTDGLGQSIFIVLLSARKVRFQLM